MTQTQTQTKEINGIVFAETTTQSGEPIVWATGNTYQNRRVLRGMGFFWASGRKAWGMKTTLAALLESPAWTTIVGNTTADTTTTTKSIEVCPTCGSHNTEFEMDIEDGGGIYYCRSCGEQWDAAGYME